MSEKELQADLRDVAAGILTPYENDSGDEIRYEELASTAEWLYDEGIRLFLACANISEYHSLSHSERIDSVRTAREAIPSDGTVLGGVGGSTKTAIDLAKAHEANGADGIMLMPPDHVFKHEQGMIEYYDRIASAVDIGVVPYMRGFEVTPRLLESVVEIDGIVGIKWAISDIELFSECVSAVEEDVVWICGMAEPPAPAYYYEGAGGFSAGVTNFIPRLGLELFDALEAEDRERARRLRDLSYPFMNLRGERGDDNVYQAANSVPAVKAGLEFAGQYGGPVREPLVELSERDYERARQYYEDIETELASVVR